MKCSRTKCQYKAVKCGLCKKHYDNLDLRGDIPRGPVAERIQLLRRRGYSWESLAGAVGVSAECLQNNNPCVRVETAARVFAVPVPDRVADFGGIVPSIGSARRLRALMAIGYPQNYLAGELGVDRRNLCRVFSKPGVSAGFAVKIDNLFRRLELIPGPSDRARRLAVLRGWYPPLSWDEECIDDPDAVPNTGARVRVSAADRIQELLDLGVTGREQIAARLGVTPQSVERALTPSRNPEAA